MELTYRPRRLRRTPALRALVREHQLAPTDFIYPLFVHEGAPFVHKEGIDEVGLSLIHI